MIWVSICVSTVAIVTMVTISTGYKHLNTVWIAGPIYWIVRDSDQTKRFPVSLSFGFMRQTSHPWKTGWGVQVRVCKYIYQFGVCRKPRGLDDQSGLLYAVKGRILDTPITEIGEWQ